VSQIFNQSSSNDKSNLTLVEESLRKLKENKIDEEEEYHILKYREYLNSQKCLQV
jgi:hypothetical protein